MPHLKLILAAWLPIAVVTTAVCVLVYVSVQQSLRQSANDPQIQMAEDAAGALSGGAVPESVLPASRIEISRSLAPFMVVFNSDGTATASSGLLHGQPLHLPAGVLDNVRLHGETRLTLQPAPDARVASVIVPYTGNARGFVLAGRSLREIEARESQTRVFAGIAWVASLVISLLAVSICSAG
jgi:hypothetical protein